MLHGEVKDYFASEYGLGLLQLYRHGSLLRLSLSERKERGLEKS